MEEVEEEEKEEKVMDEALENDLCQLWDVSMNAVSEPTSQTALAIKRNDQNYSP